jgi:hypothetical protein
MTDFEAELQQVLEAPRPLHRRAAANTPPWSPGLQHDGTTGTLTSGPLDADSPDWDAIFAHWNLSPDEWDVDTGSLRVNAWEGPTADGTTIFRQYKATIRRRTSASTVPVDDHLRSLSKWRPRKPVAAAGGATFVVCFADWQVGGGSSAEFVLRFTETLAQLHDHAKRAAKEDCDKLAVLYLGDMTENVQGNYSSQLFEADLTLREQIRVVRQCETLALKTLAPLFSSTQAVAVAGNHGRGGPKVLTTPEDNADLIAFEGVAEVLTESGAADTYGITFVAPETRSIGLIDASGTNLLISHGDQVGGSAEKVKAWWHKTAFQRWGDADLGDMLITGHRHHTRVEEVGEDRWFVVCPTLGPESRWFGDMGGATSNPGTLIFRTADRRWWGMNNLRP